MRRAGVAIAASALIAATGPSALPAREERVIAVPGFADFLAVDGDGVWATNHGRVERWTRGGLTASVPMAHPCGAMAIAAGALWVADCNEGLVIRVDLATRRITARIATGIANPKGELNVVAGAGSVWVASDEAGRIARIDPATDRVAANLTVDPGTYYLAFGFGSLWAVSNVGRTLQRIDPATNRVAAKVMLGREPGFLAAGEGAVWVQEQRDGTVARIDPRTVRVTGRVKVGADLLYGDIDTGDAAVWLRTTTDQTMAVIDPASLRIVARLGAPSGSGALRVSDGGVWTSAHDIHTLTWWSVPSRPHR